MKKLKKILPASLLLLITSIPFSFTAYFFAKQKMIQHEMKEKLEQSSLHTISVPENEIHWMKTGKEILVDGKMFDVKSYSVNNGFYFLKGLFDDDETILVKQIENSTRQNNESGSRLLVQIFQLLQSIYPENHDMNITINDSNEYEYYRKPSNIISQFKTIPTPPPQG